MPKYRYDGEAPCSYGGQLVNTGDVIDASASPGKRFVLVEEPAVPIPEIAGPVSVAQVEETSTEEAPGKSRRKGGDN